MEPLIEPLVCALAAALPAEGQTNPNLAARMVVDAVDALTHRWIVDPSLSPLAADRLVEEVTRMIEAYLDDRRTR